MQQALRESETTQVKYLKDENGNWKEKASIAEIAGYYNSVINDRNLNELILELFSRFKVGEFEFKFLLNGGYLSMDRTTSNYHYGEDKDGKENRQIIFEIHNKKLDWNSRGQKDYHRRLRDNRVIENVCLYKFFENSKFCIDYKKIFNETDLSNDDSYIDGKKLGDFHTQLILKEFKPLEDTNILKPAGRISKDGIEGMEEYNKVSFIQGGGAVLDNWIYNFIINKKFKPKTDDYTEFYVNENSKELKTTAEEFENLLYEEECNLRLALAEKIFIPREDFLHWLRLERNDNDNSSWKKRGGYKALPKTNFWGDEWEGYPKSWDILTDDSEGLTLGEGFRCYSDEHKYTEYRKKISENCPNLSYPAQDQEYPQFNNDRYVQDLDGIKDHYLELQSDFIKHLKKGRIEIKAVRGGENAKGLQKISHEEVEAYLTSNLYDWDNNRLHDQSVYGFKVFRKSEANTDKTFIKPAHKANAIAIELKKSDTIPETATKELCNTYKVSYKTMQKAIKLASK